MTSTCDLSDIEISKLVLPDRSIRECIRMRAQLETHRCRKRWARNKVHGNVHIVHIQIVNALHRRGNVTKEKKKNIRIRKLMYNRSRKKDNRLHNGHWFHMCNTYNIEGACSKPYEELVILSTGVSHGRAGYAKNFVIRNVSLSRNRGTDFPFGTRKIDGIYIYIFRIKFSLNKLAC